MTANVAGKTATVAVVAESAHRHHHHGADNVDRRWAAGIIHFCRERDREHPRRRESTGATDSRSLSARSPDPPRRRTPTRKPELTRCRRRRPTPAGSRKPCHRSITVLPAQPPTVQVTPSNLSADTERDDHRPRAGNRQHVEHHPLRLEFRRRRQPAATSTTSNQVPVSWNSIGTKVSRSPPFRPLARAVTASLRSRCVSRVDAPRHTTPARARSRGRLLFPVAHVWRRGEALRPSARG